ncbi:MAG: redox-regulated ATPase YchF [Sedimentisphaerales bacterium]|nr:redox-regulated ATPase YchF [Sedimentisphaerales bacterium]
MKVAVIGMMQSGKSTLVSAVCGRQVGGPASMHIEEVVVPVPDERLDWLTELYQPKKTVHATVDCLDVPGFSFSDEHGRAAARRLFNQFRTVDMFVIVVNAFSEGNPAGELSELKTEMLLADLELVTTRVERLEAQIHKPTKTQSQDKAELSLQKRLQEALESEQSISTAVQNEEEATMIKSLGFLTLKPMMVVVNVGEDALTSPVDLSGKVGPDTQVITLCAELEKELSQLDPASRTEFMSDYGLTAPAANQFVQSCYSTLGLISFLTVGKDEVRAWPIRRGTWAHDAAGKVHSDIKRGFIRAETIAYEDIRTLGGEKECKAAGKYRLEGKSYIVQDGDIINFRFNV